MSWEYKYHEDVDETAIYWNDEEQARIDGRITSWWNGYPADDAAREAVVNTIQSAGTPDRIRMQYDFNYGFKERDTDR